MFSKRLTYTLFLISVVPFAAPARAGVFRTGKSYLTGEFPAQGAIADFNNDGISDTVSANSNDRNVSVLLGKGDGTFGAATTFAVGDGAADVASADLNGDGNADLVVTDGDPFEGGGNSVSIALGNGDGTFRAPATIKVSSNPTGIAIADLNHDGIPDIALAITGPVNNSSGSLTVLIGKGDGTFAAPVNYSINHKGERLVVADLNGDGNLDVAMAVQHFSSEKNGLAIFLGNGDGTFQAGTTSVPNDACDVAAGDFNGDGKVDLALAQFPSVLILLGNGDGTVQKPVATGAGGTTVVTADLNHDGVLDLVLGGASVTTLFGNGDGTFGTPTAYAAGESFAKVGYLNGDQNLDVVAKSGFSAIGVTLGGSKGTFRAGLNYSAGYLADSLAAADFNGDGKLDLVVGASNNGFATDLVLLFGDGNGDFTPGTLFGTIQAELVQAGDFNGDGKADVLFTGFSGGAVYTYLGNGDGTFGPLHGTPVVSGDLSTVVGDFNGDGLSDVAVARSQSNALAILLSNGDGTFRDAGDYPTGKFPQLPIIADFNGDSIPDVEVTNVTGSTVDVFPGNGDGTFQNAIATASLNAVYSAAGDLNGDGKTDLVVGGNTLQLFLGNGDGTFQAAQSLYPNYGPVQIMDVDGDGKLDVFFADGNSVNGNSYLLLRGDGHGNFHPPLPFPIGSQFAGYFLLRDLNGDGLPELMAANGGSISVLTNTSKHKAKAALGIPWRYE